MCMFSSPSPPPAPAADATLAERKAEEERAAAEERARQARAKGRASLLNPDTGYSGVPDEDEQQAGSARTLLLGN